MVDATVRELFILLYYVCLVKLLQHLLLDEDFAGVTSVSKPEKLRNGSMLYVDLHHKATELSADSELSWPFIKQNSPLKKHSLDPMGSKKILSIIYVGYTLKKLQVQLHFAVAEKKETKFAFHQ